MLPAARLRVRWSQSSPITSVSRRSASRCLRITRVARRRPSSVRGQVAVALDGEQPVALHPRHRLRHGGAALVQALGDARPQRHDALLDQAHRWSGGISVVSIRSLTGTFSPMPTPAGAVDSDALRDVVPPRPPARGQPRSARGRRGRRAALFVLDPALWGPASRSAGPTSAPRSARWTPRSPRRRRWRWSRAIRYAAWSRRRARSAPPGCTSRPTTAPTGTGGTSTSSRRWPTPASEPLRTGSPYAVAPAG